MAGLVVGGNGSGDGRERNACGGRISISGGLGQFSGGGSVVQAHKAAVDSASSGGSSDRIDPDADSEMRAKSRAAQSMLTAGRLDGDRH